MLPPGFTYLPGALSPEAAEDAFQGIFAETPWEEHVFAMFGRTVPMPRRIAWVGEVAYAYSGITHPPRAWTPRLAELRARVEALSGVALNVVLLNLYRDGADSMGWHSDDDYDTGGQPVIASLSLGATRRFLLRHKRRKVTVAVDLEPGSLLVMGEGSQAEWRHRLPRVSGPVGVRINLTFRHMAGG